MASSVTFMDTSIRDGHQSLWATRMTTAQMLPIASTMDQVGFEAIDLMGSTPFDVCVRYIGDNPWERMRLMRQRMPRTPLAMGFPGQSFLSFGLIADDLVELIVKRSATNGANRITLMDGLNDIRNLQVGIRATKELGLHATGRLVFSLGPVFTDEYYAQKVREVVQLGVDAVLLKDPSGILTPERVKTLIPTMQKAANGLPLNIHAHCNTGMAPLCYLEAISLGVTGLNTSVAPLANGASLPSVETVAKNAKRMGYEVDLDEQALSKMTSYFYQLAQQLGKPVGQPAEYDLFLYEHHIPGGMISNFKFQLATLGIEDKLEEILEETCRVRADLGYPIMVSPFSQIAAVQASLNILHGQYAVIPDEVKKLTMGYYGATPAPPNPNLLDKVAEGQDPVTKRAGELLPPVLEKVRKERGPFDSDDDLVLAALFSPGILESFRTSAAAKKTENQVSVKTPLVTLVKQVARRRKITHFSLRQSPHQNQSATTT